MVGDDDNPLDWSYDGGGDNDVWRMAEKYMLVGPE